MRLPHIDTVNDVFLLADVNSFETLKDNSLKTLQEDIHWEKRFHPEQTCKVLRVKDKKQTTQ